MHTPSEQIASGGTSTEEIVNAALEAACPEPNLTWLDIGCGRGALLRKIRDAWEPAALCGVDPIDWLDADLRTDVAFQATSVEDADSLPVCDRVLLVEVIEHLEAPWRVLRKAARLVAPCGRIVVSTPNLATLRNRLELALRGGLASFRVDHPPHVSPALPHVVTRILSEEGLMVEALGFAGSDVISLTGGRVWPEGIRSRLPKLTSVSLIVSASRARGAGLRQTEIERAGHAPQRS